MDGIGKGVTLQQLYREEGIMGTYALKKIYIVRKKRRVNELWKIREKKKEEKEEKRGPRQRRGIGRQTVPLPKRDEVPPWRAAHGHRRRGEGSLLHQGSEAASVVRHCTSLPRDAVSAKGSSSASLIETARSGCTAQRMVSSSCSLRNGWQVPALSLGI
ncbi:hypothetical protein E2C01_102836 [Portunus trituberculatus]|uniref:Uncharacterized protein n=1 Tax=Portunus trituberculatus TaxID=210409 RepID=A0A5B7KJG3_PORTR|nr:hypothetical protein [Portunus trituberculatus]